LPLGPNGEQLPYPEQAPPDLMAMLGGGSAEEPEPPADPSELLREMLSLASAYRDSEEDDEDLLVIEKVGTLIQQLLANQQKESDGMLQGKSSPRAMRRAYR
jgi:hypothetical protein